MKIKFRLLKKMSVTLFSFFKEIRLDWYLPNHRAYLTFKRSIEKWGISVRGGANTFDKKVSCERCFLY
jgi:hypothetical protein